MAVNWMLDEHGRLYSIKPDGSRDYLPDPGGSYGTDARGIHYVIGPDGQIRYSAPSPFAPGGTPGHRLPNPDIPHDSFLHNVEWDDKTGTWKKKLNWNNIAVLGAAGAIAGPAAYSAFGGGGVATPLAHVGGGAATTGATTAATTGAAEGVAGVESAINAYGGLAAGYGIPSGITAASEGVNIAAPALASTSITPAIAFAPGAAIPAAAPGLSGVASTVAPYVGGLVLDTKAGLQQVAPKGTGFWGTLGKKLLGLGDNGNSNNGNGAYGPALLRTGAEIYDMIANKRAVDKATQQLVDAGNKALEFEQQRYGDAKTNFNPYIATGQQANQTMAQALMPANGPAPTAANLAPQFTNAFYANSQNNGQRMVNMQAPNGQTRQVPDFLVPHYTAQGGKVA